VASTTRRAYKRWHWRKQVCLKKETNQSGIKTGEWIEHCPRDPDIVERILETNVGLKQGSFKKGRKGERRKENTRTVLV
jgi:hypothetical protein